MFEAKKKKNNPKRLCPSPEHVQSHLQGALEAGGIYILDG
jgi:hypothetical protein